MKTVNECLQCLSDNISLKENANIDEVENCLVFLGDTDSPCLLGKR